MTLYADLPARRARQISADVLVLLWVAVWAWVGKAVHDATMQLAEPGRRLEEAGDGLRDRLRTAGDSVDDLPVLEDRVAEPFRSSAEAGVRVADAGRDMVEAVERLATTLGWVTALVPIIIVTALWFTVRARFVRRARAARSLIDSTHDLDLFALRAMANQPMTRLAKISPDPVGAWRAGDPGVIRELAVLELADCGLRPPRDDADSRAIAG